MTQTAPTFVVTVPGSDGAPAATLRHIVEVLDRDGGRRMVPAGQVREQGEATVATGCDDVVDVRLTLRPTGEVHALRLELTWTGPPTDAALRVAIELPGEMEQPRWLVPGIFYRENRPEGSAVRYPQAVLEGGDPSQMSSPWWSFRSDRAATPAVFGWTRTACVGVAAPPATPLGMTGLGFSAEGPPQVWVDLPYREGPVVYRGDQTPGDPVATTHRLAPGDRVEVELLVHVAPPDPHAYDRLLRAAYERSRSSAPLAPWMDVDQAAALTAHGLFTWHWHPEHDALYEAVAFDRAHPDLDRPTMHVAWISGIPWAASLLRYGRRTGDARYVDAGTRVIDLFCRELTPSGTFWGEWRLDRGWSCGWNRHPDRLHARTLAEATLFTLRAVQAERRVGAEHPTWIDAASSNLAVAVASQDANGNLGSYYHQATGAVEDRRGAAGLLWVAALAEGAHVLGRPELIDVARRAGAHYAAFVDDAFVNGAPEDVHLAPTSEDAYNAVLAFVALSEVDDDPRWLRLARRAADWTMTFRYSYNVAFDDHTILRDYGFATRGADNASPPNQHLHAYGLIALEPLVALWRATGDRYYLDRARDNLACFLQLIAREDGDLNARKGMVTERTYHTDCFQPKGSLLTLSHAWCVGVTLLGCQVALDDPEAFPPGLGWAHDGGSAESAAPTPGPTRTTEPAREQEPLTP